VLLLSWLQLRGTTQHACQLLRAWHCSNKRTNRTALQCRPLLSATGVGALEKHSDSISAHAPMACHVQLVPYCRHTPTSSCPPDCADRTAGSCHLRSSPGPAVAAALGDVAASSPSTQAVRALLPSGFSSAACPAAAAPGCEARVSRNTPKNTTCSSTTRSLPVCCLQIAQAQQYHHAGNWTIYAACRVSVSSK
jgi:hypothetical protein